MKPFVRVTTDDDVAALARLRALWMGGDEPEFAARMGEWLATEGARRTTWLALLEDEPVGMASMFEYRRMPKPGRAESRWGYVSNMFVREDRRNAGIGSALLASMIATAEERGYARLVLSPSERAVPFYERAGFVLPDASLDGDRLLVRPGK